MDVDPLERLGLLFQRSVTMEKYVGGYDSIFGDQRDFIEDIGVAAEPLFASPCCYLLRRDKKRQHRHYL
jgi:hypothetical protein